MRHILQRLFALHVFTDLLKLLYHSKDSRYSDGIARLVININQEFYDTGGGKIQELLIKQGDSTVSWTTSEITSVRMIPFSVSPPLG